MAFALITRAGKKLNVQKIALDQTSKIARRTQERIMESEKQQMNEREQMKEHQAKIAMQLQM